MDYSTYFVNRLGQQIQQYQTALRATKQNSDEEAVVKAQIKFMQERLKEQ